MLYLADMVLPMSSPPIPQGAVRIEDNRIVALGSAASLPAQPGERVIDLGASTLLPGLINAHCHLDYTRFRGALESRHGFTEWIKNINGLRRSFTSVDYIEAIAEGFTLLAEGGITTVANIESFPELLPQLPIPPLRTWWFLELIDVRTRIDQDETLLGALPPRALHRLSRSLPPRPHLRRYPWDALHHPHCRIGRGTRDVHPRQRSAL